MEEKIRRDSIIDTVKKNINKIGYNFDALSEKDKNYLILLENAITDTFDLEKTAKDMLAKNTVTVQGIASKTAIARATIYNNHILKEYINYRSIAFNKIDASRNDIAKDEEIKRLKEEIEILHIRDVELEEAKLTIKKLKQDIKNKEATILSLKKQNKNNVYPFK